MNSIADKVAVVTGASSGIGLGIARELARAGATVVLAARSAQKLEAIAAEITAEGGRAIAIPTDVTDEAAVIALFRETERQAGVVSILVNNAGIADDTAIEDLSLDHWRHVLDTNLTSAFLCSREAVRAMKRAGRPGRIINIGSLSAKIPRPHSPAYTASKFAIEGMTRQIALDGRGDNITASVLHPGATLSSLVPGATDRMTQDYIEPEDIGKLVVLMASLPDDITMLDTTVLPVKVPFLGRG